MCVCECVLGVIDREGKKTFKSGKYDKFKYDMRESEREGREREEGRERGGGREREREGGREKEEKGRGIASCILC